MKVVITGGCGFIGSALVRLVLRETDVEVVNIDKLTYAATTTSVEGAAESARYHFEQIDICDAAQIERILREHKPDGLIHLAAESHVDRSIDAPADFIQTNVFGTFVLLQACLGYVQSGAAPSGFRFHHVSTDEVFGSLPFDSPGFAETHAYDPSSPYSASKAAADHLARAWQRTFKLPVVLSNCSNNYGPYQFPEKLIPLMILKAHARRPLPVYGRGENVRDWLHVEDHAHALWRIFTQGQVGESYNIGGNSERSNLEVVSAICDILDDKLPSGNGPRRELIQFVQDRPGHDLRYAIDASKLAATLDWHPAHDFEAGLRSTVDWYLQREDWWRPVLERHGAPRIGLGKPE